MWAPVGSHPHLFVVRLRLIGVGRSCYFRVVRLRERSRFCRPRRARPTGVFHCPGDACSFCRICRSDLTRPARTIRCRPRGGLNARHCRPRPGACRTGTTCREGFAPWLESQFVLRRRGLFAGLAWVQPMRRCGRPILRAKKSPHLVRHLPRETSRLFGRSQCRWQLGCVRRSAHGPLSPGPGSARRTARPKLPSAYGGSRAANDPGRATRSCRGCRGAHSRGRSTNDPSRATRSCRGGAGDPGGTAPHRSGRAARSRWRAHSRGRAANDPP